MIQNTTTDNPAPKNRHFTVNKKNNTEKMKRKNDFRCKYKPNQQLNDFKKLKSLLWTVED